MGVSHWLRQRYSAVVMLPLCCWFCYAITRVVAGNEAFRHVVSSPPASISMIVLIFATLYHANLGMGTVIPDYIKRPVLCSSVLLLINSCTAISGLVATLAIVKVCIG